MRSPSLVTFGILLQRGGATKGSLLPGRRWNRRTKMWEEEEEW